MKTPFVHDAWYVIAWAEELTGAAPVARTVLTRPLVVFKDTEGAVHALEDRCPHRGVPLSMGQVVGGHIRCAYHGLEFDGRGVCVRNPHVRADPSRLQVRRYPVALRHDAVWVWMGEAERADPSRIPDYGLFATGTPNYRAIRGYLGVAADYRLVIDNLLDLSHAEYLHANTVGTSGSAGSVKTSLDAEEDRVTVLRKVFDLSPSAVFKPVWTRTERIDQQANMTWRPPSHLMLDLGIMPPGGELSEGLHFPSAHILTPETERSTHYFYAVARNFSQDDAALDDTVRATFVKAFAGEDRPIIEAIQRAVVDPDDGFRFVDFTSGDAAARRVRRALERMTEEARPISA
ncbi:MAG: aromatic ring-hydroxylating dioxygenase subunit alpha [Burkholderiaceae bacterium]|nr:aromatic ring-hydroxylating dioxygenase subunit alpha [Burkholderiaceae bacterium]